MNDKKDEINEMFSTISDQYDLMNHIMSLNIDKLWRTDAASDAILSKKKYRILDVAAGTGDLSIEVARLAAKNGKDVDVLAYDFNKDMLVLARKKFEKLKMGNLKVECGSAFEINHKPGTFDVVISGFGLRSFSNSKGGKRNLQKFISESYKVLKPKGRIVLLDMALPDNVVERNFFKFHSKFMIFAGSFVDKSTYEWLVRTIKNFDKKELVSMVKSVGFKNVKIRSLVSGVAFVLTAEK